jgi:hypothetical protein
VLSLAAAACAGLLIAASAGGRVWLAVVLAVAQLLLVVGWFRAAELTTRWQAAGGLVAVAGAVAADVAVLRSADTADPAGAAGAASAASRADVRALTAVLAVVVGLAFVVQLVRRDGRARLTDALAVTIATGALAVAGAVLLGVRGGRAGADVVAVALVAGGLAVLPVQRWLPLWLSAPLGLAIGVGVGVAIASQSADVGAGSGSAVAVTAAVLALVARVAVGFSGVSASWPGLQTPRRAWPVATTLPIALLAPAVLVVARITVG